MLGILLKILVIVGFLVSVNIIFSTDPSELIAMLSIGYVGTVILIGFVKFRRFYIDQIPPPYIKAEGIKEDVTDLGEDSEVQTVAYAEQQAEQERLKSSDWFDDESDFLSGNPDLLEFLRDVNHAEGDLEMMCAESGEKLEDLLIHLQNNPKLNKYVKRIVHRHNRERHRYYFIELPNSFKSQTTNPTGKKRSSGTQTIDKGILDMSDEEYLELVAEAKAQAESRVPIPSAIIDRTKLNLQVDMFYSITGGLPQSKPNIVGFQVQETKPVKLVEIISSGGYVYLGGNDVGDTLVFERVDGGGSEKILELTTDIMVPAYSDIQKVQKGQKGQLETLLPKLSPSHEIVSMCYRFKPN